MFSPAQVVTDVCDMIAGHLMADRGACVSDCGAGRHANSDGKCVPCDGPCPKSKFYRLVNYFLSGTDGMATGKVVMLFAVAFGAHDVTVDSYFFLSL